MTTFQVPVMVTVVAVQGCPGPDSAQVAEALHTLNEYDAERNGHSRAQQAWEIADVSGIPSDEDDPNSPPVPATKHDDLSVPLNDDSEWEVTFTRPPTPVETELDALNQRDDLEGRND